MQNEDVDAETCCIDEDGLGGENNMQPDCWTRNDLGVVNRLEPLMSCYIQSAL